MKRHTQTGLSLMEVLLSMVIIGVLATVSIYFISSFSQNTRARTDTQLQAFARSYMDDLKAFWAIPGNYDTNQTPVSGGLALTPPTGYTYTVTIKNALSNSLITAYDYSTNKNFTPYVDPTKVPLKMVTLVIKDPKAKTNSFSIMLAQPTQ